MIRKPNAVRGILGYECIEHASLPYVGLGPISALVIVFLSFLKACALISSFLIEG